MASAVSDDEKKRVIVESIRGVPDFPKKGILFWDVTTILLNPTAFQYVIDLFTAHYRDQKVDVVAGAPLRRELRKAMPVAADPACNFGLAHGGMHPRFTASTGGDRHGPKLGPDTAMHPQPLQPHSQSLCDPLCAAALLLWQGSKHAASSSVLLLPWPWASPLCPCASPASCQVCSRACGTRQPLHKGGGLPGYVGLGISAIGCRAARCAAGHVGRHTAQVGRGLPG